MAIMIDPSAWLWMIIVILGFVISFMIVLILLFRDSKTHFLYYETDDVCREIKKKIKKGENKIKIGKAKFDIRKSKPSLKKTFFGDKAFYIVDHKFPEPLKRENGTLKGEFMDAATIDAITEMSVLESFLKMDWLKKGKFGLMELIIGAVIGLMAGLLAHYAGVL